MLDYARQRANEVLKIPRKAVLATADEFITRLWRIAGVNGIPRHILPAVFTETELRNICHTILLLIGEHEVIYKPEQVIQRETSLVPNLKARIIPNANHNAKYTNTPVVNRKNSGLFGR